MDPFSIAGAVTAAKETLDQVGGAWDKFKLLRGDFGLFWRHFERAVKREHLDVPLDQMKRYQNDPDFIGRVTVVIAKWDLKARSEIEKMFERDLTPVASGRFETKEKLAAFLMDAVLESAHHTALEFQKEPRQILGAIDSSRVALADHFDKALRAQTDEERERRYNEIEEIVRRVVNEKETARAADAEQTGLEASASKTSARPITSLAQRGDPGRSPENLVAELATEDETGASHLRELLEDGGATAVVVYLRGRDGVEEGDSLPFLVTAARIAAKAGAFAESEEAYLWASRLDGLDDHARARQVVRAAAMAQLHSGEERFRELLEEARTLDPDHPGLALAEARASRDSAWVLDRLANVVPENDHEAALLHITRAQTHLALGEEDSAADALEKARAADPLNISVREFEGILPVIVAQRQVAHGEQPDRPALLYAGEAFLGLRSGLEEQGRWNESAQLAARASEAFALGDEFDRAAAVLASVKRVERLSVEARADLGRASLVTRRPDLVLSFVSESATRPDLLLLRADAQALGEDAEARREAVETLTELLEEEDEDIRRGAAFTLLAAAATERDVSWNDDAATIVASVRPLNVAIFRAEHLRLHDQADQAEQELLPHVGEKQALRRLRDYAAQAGEWDKAKDRSRSLIRNDPSPLDRLTNAQIQLDSGDPDEAKTQFLAVGHDDQIADEFRNRAFAAVMEIVAENRNYAAIRDVAVDWRDHVPSSLDAIWNLVFALARLAEHPDAYEITKNSGLEARTLQQARLLAEVLYRGAPKDEAVRRLEALSTQFGREEQMEALLILTFLEAEQAGVELDEELSQEVGRRFRSFPDRFPESKVLWRVDAPETAEELHELMREMHSESAAAQKRVRQQITDGVAPVNALAVVSPVKEVGSAWARLDALPMGFAMAAVDDHERTLASEAIGSAAVWDPSSLCTVGGLGRTYEDKIKSALPGSLIVNETLEDADSAATGLSRGGRSETEMGYDPDAGQAYIENVAAEEVTRQRLRAEGMLRLAKEFDIQPGPGDGVDQDLVEILHDPEEPHAWKPFIGTVMLAQRTKRPIFSDDRWVRQFAREHGIKAFGTLALLDALADRGIISADERMHARLRLAASRAWGVALTTEEMVAAARAVQWDISKTTAGAISDRAAWRSKPGERIQDMIGFLREAHTEAPETMGKWLRRIIEIGVQIAPHLDASWWPRSILVMAWGIDQATPSLSDEAFQALVQEVQSLPLHLTTLGADPVLEAIAEILGYFMGNPEPVRVAVFNRLVRRLRLPDQMRAFQAFVS
jgi:tetratricopeptide (TPR) repeat protein